MTLRTIPPLLQQDLDDDVGTFCHLLKIKAADGTIVALTDLDREVVYDPGDGDGPITFVPDPGIDPGEMEARNDFSVDGGDGLALVPVDATPLSPDDIRAGKWDSARFNVFFVNYMDLSHGHYEPIPGGIVGDITLRDDGLLILQLNGPTQPLKQNIVSLTSKTCRAVHGSQEGEAVEFCGYDVSGDWVAFTVTNVDPDDNARTFEASGLSEPAGYFFPGVVIWDTGSNASYFTGVDSHQSGGVISLHRPMPRAIQIGDTGRIRITCTKFVEGRRGCREFFGDDWVLRFRGEPDMDSVVNAQEPGARLPPGAGGATTVPDQTEEQ